MRSEGDGAGGQKNILFPHRGKTLSACLTDTMTKQILMVLALLLAEVLQAQTYTQTIKGTVSDKNLLSPVAGVRIWANGDTASSVLSDSNGYYELKAVPVGRIQLNARHSRYAELSLPNLLLSSGKELVVNLQMEEQVTAFGGFSLKGRKNTPGPVNEMATVSARTFSVEETQKFAAAVNDPARMATSFAGVVGADDGNNTIVIRGNSPAAMLWRMEGIDIPGPNHFSAFNGSGGGISLLSAQLLSNSDFMTGAFAPEYGNALSGVFDLRLRKGNSTKREYTLQAGFLGLDFAAEGPLSKKGGSFLINYRYSTLGIIKKLGIELGPSSTLFQDLSFNIALPKSRLGAVTIFGFGGLSTQLQSAKKDSGAWKYLSDRYNIFYGSNTGAAGITHLISLSKNSTLRTVALASANSISDRGEYYQNDYIRTYTHWKNVIGNSKLAISSTLNQKLGSRLHLRAGITATAWYYNTRQLGLDSTQTLRTTLDSDGETGYLQGFAQVKAKLSRKFSMVAGFHALYLYLNGSRSLEPRISGRYELSRRQALSLGYGLHSQLQLPGVYFAQTTGSDGQVQYPNRKLGLSRAHHLVAAYELTLKSRSRLKLEAYYQHLFNIPVGVAPGSTLSLLNMGFGLMSDPLTNKGLGRNYGVELTAERFLNKGFYYLLSASLYSSTYKAMNGNWYQTRFNGRHALTFTAGKEIKVRGDKKLFGINLKTTWYGGFRQTPVDAAMSRLTRGTVYDESRPNSIQLPAYFRSDLKFSYRINHARYNSVWSLDIQNASNRKNVGGTYYDVDREETRTWYQTPLIPVFSYKIEF